MVHGFGGFRDMVHELHGLDKILELEDPFDGAAILLPAGELVQRLLNLGIG
jgi:hypothetical protein